MGDVPANNRPGHDVYTVLVILASAMVIGSTVYLLVRGQQLFGSWNPFSGA